VHLLAEPSEQNQRLLHSRRHSFLFVGHVSPHGSCGSVEVALSLGGPLVVEPGGTALALCTLLSLGGAPLALLGRSCVLICDRRMLLGTFALLLRLILLLRRGDGMSLGFLTMPGDLAAKALAFTLALATPGFGQSPGRKHDQRHHDYDGKNDRDDDNR